MLFVYFNSNKLSFENEYQINLICSNMYSRIIIPIILSIFLLVSIQANTANIKTKIFFSKNYEVCTEASAMYYRLCGWSEIDSCYNGVFTDHLLDDKLILKGAYVNGKKEGEFTFFDENGVEELKAFFTEDIPSKTWIWYYPDHSTHFSIKFDQDAFHFVDIYNGKGISQIDKEFNFKCDLTYARSKQNIQIKGKIKKRNMLGKWVLTKNKVTQGFDIYKKGEYVNSVNTFRKMGQMNKRIISVSTFIPDRLNKFEKIRINKEVGDSDYPFLVKYSNWKPINSAIGISGDSLIMAVDQNPKYFGGMNGINKTIARNINLGFAMKNKTKWGSVYYELIIDEEGTIEDINIIKSPDKALSLVAMKALVFLENFRPAYHNEMPIKSKYSSRIVMRNLVPNF